jgi:hypothetical protein
MVRREGERKLRRRALSDLAIPIIARGSDRTVWSSRCFDPFSWKIGKEKSTPEGRGAFLRLSGVERGNVQPDLEGAAVGAPIRSSVVGLVDQRRRPIRVPFVSMDDDSHSQH